MNNILTLAADVRSWAEKTVTEYESQNDEYPSFDVDDLTGFCAYAAYEMFDRYLTYYKDKFSMKICHNNGHCFNVVNDQYIVDVTASQFKKDKIVIVPIKDAKEQYWRRLYSYKTLDGFVNNLVKTRWMKHQIPKLVLDF